MIRDLGADAIEWLRGLPATAVFEDEVLLCHGSPTDDLCYLLEDVTSGHPQVRDEEEIVRLLAGAAQPVIVCGHTHIPRLVRLANGQTIVNPGSVGLVAYSDDKPVPHAMENYSPDASYAILEKTSSGWDATFRSVPYDTREASRTAAELGRSDWAYQIATVGRRWRSVPRCARDDGRRVRRQNTNGLLAASGSSNAGAGEFGRIAMRPIRLRASAGLLARRETRPGAVPAAVRCGWLRRFSIRQVCGSELAAVRRVIFQAREP